MARDRPSGTVTFLFTDIEDSTRLWDDDPVAMEAALARHDDILKQSVERHNGYVFATGGDGFAAAFHTPDAAVDAAVDAQGQLDTETFAGGLQIRVRMGIDLGTTDERDGDYFGPVVNRAARIMSAGHGGQILASSTARRLLRTDHESIGLGAHGLKGIADPVSLVQINTGAGTQVFPPLRTLDSAPGNLTVAGSTFVGRTGELDKLTERLGTQPLVTITGVGGTGKTRLATETAHRLRGRFGDGAWMVELADIADSKGVAAHVAATFGLRPDPATTDQVQVVDWLRGSESLVILDNCEHVLDGAASLALSIGEACPRVRVIATSREPLLVDGEHVFPLGSLPVEPIDGVVAPAVELFNARATAERGSWLPSHEVQAEVEQLCRRLDGIPLAIELAAARARTMSVGDVLERLDRRFRLLTGGRRATVERHKTLHATVDWSYQLLTPTDQLVFDRLSVFAGRFGLADAEAICADDEVDELQVVDALADLVDKSMVEVQPDLRGAEYRLLETMEAFGAENSDKRDETVRLRDRHAAHYIALAAKLQHDLVGPNEAETLRRARLAGPDLRAALDWVATGDDHPALASLSRSLIWFTYCGWLDPARWVDDVAADTQGGVHGFAESAAFAGVVLHGEPDRALARLAPLRAEDPLDVEFMGLFTIVVCSLLAGEPHQGRDAAERMLAIGDASDNPAERAFSAFGLGNLKPIVGEPDEALAQHFIRAAEQEQSATARSYALSTGSRMFLQSDQPRAVEMLEQACHVAIAAGSTDALANALLGLLSPNIDRLPLEEAAIEAARTLKLTEQLGNTAVQRSTLGLTQVVCERLGRHDIAAMISGHLDDRRQPVSPAEQERYDESVRRLHDALEAGTLDTLRSQGATLSTREVARQVAAALDGEDSSGRSSDAV